MVHNIYGIVNFLGQATVLFSTWYVCRESVKHWQQHRNNDTGRISFIVYRCETETSNDV